MPVDSGPSKGWLESTFGLKKKKREDVNLPLEGASPEALSQARRMGLWPRKKPEPEPTGIFGRFFGKNKKDDENTARAKKQIRSLAISGSRKKE